ncbi:MAG TPA: DMT family transporter [Myxococcaceae bacterium]|nr:DMT family transporter [Myxococcaceae bacterium]
MSAILLALGSALGYGVADFMAGWLSRRSHYARVSLIAQLAAGAGTLLASFVVGGRPSGASLAWGALSGLGGGLGTLALYRGLARGQMNIVAPLSGVLAAAIPALLGLALGERPGPGAMVGLVVALPAVWLTAQGEGQGGAGPGSAASRSVMDGVLAGLGFAVLFIGLQRAGRGEGLWPTAASQVAAAVPMLVLHARALRRPAEPQDAWLRLGPVLAGVLVGLAAIFFFLGTQRGLLTVVAVLTSLYPAVTVALARWLLAERIGRWQGVGLALAGVSVALISAG